jgi:hypothetical protein
VLRIYFCVYADCSNFHKYLNIFLEIWELISHISSMYIHRKIEQKLWKLSDQFPVIGILGPRQVGKTTLIKHFITKINKKSIYLDLEKPSDIEKLSEPELYLSEHKNCCVVLDEVQQKPNIFPIIRSLVDEHRVPLRFIILGSASPDLLRQSSESLAGRIAYLELSAFCYPEISKTVSLRNHHFYGGFPNSILAKSSAASKDWLDNFVKTYIERDLPLLGFPASPDTARKLWEMLAWQNGSMINYSGIGKSLGLTNKTISHYMEFLQQAFLIHQLPPYHLNIKKRLVKSSKIFLRDTGILHRLLRIEDYDQLSGTPLIGHSWEAYVIEQIKCFADSSCDFYFYRTHAGAEVDLVLTKGIKPQMAIEIKYTAAPKMSKSLLSCMDDLQTTQNYIIIPTPADHPLHSKVRVCDVKSFLENYL